MNTLPFTVDQAGLFFLIFVRVITIIAFLPVFGSFAVPPQAKVAFSLILTILIFATDIPKIKAVGSDFTLPLFGLLIVKEVLVGIAVGFVASMLFTAVQFAGRLVDTEIGFGFVELIDPMNNETVTVLGQLQVILFTILFLTFNGHYFMLLAIERSFELIPLLGGVLPGNKVAEHIVSITGAVFETALKLSAPVYVTLILSEVALGVVARTVPQINIFFVGMPLKIAVGLLSMALALPMLGMLFRTTVNRLMEDIWKLLFIMA